MEDLEPDFTKYALDDTISTFLEEWPPEKTALSAFLGAQFDVGLAWVHFPVGLGGLGAARIAGLEVAERLRLAGAPNMRLTNYIGYGMAAPTIISQGSNDQKARYLRRIFTCEDIWCQLFSEPGAGSDLAGLATQAVKDGDEWIVNGQKVWSSLAHRSRFGLLLARTDPTAEKHYGLTYFVLDMNSAGVDVRPIRQLTGDAEFNEVFLSDVRIPDSERLSEVGKGWQGALVTLMNERVAIGRQSTPRGGGPIGVALEVWAKSEHKSIIDRDRLTQLWIRSEVLRFMGERSSLAATAGVPGPDGSLGKVATAKLSQDVFEFCNDALGAAGMLFESYQSENEYILDEVFEDAQRMFLRSRSATIAGGTTEVMLNIIGERLLDLPGDVRADKGIPWLDVLRS